MSAVLPVSATIIPLKSNNKGKPMSSNKFRWARQQKTGSASANAVLKSLTWFANDELLAYPSIQTLAEDTELNRKTVESALVKLLDEKLIVDSGFRAGKTKSVVVYKLNVGIDELSSYPNSGVSTNEATPIFPVSYPKIGVQKEYIIINIIISPL